MEQQSSTPELFFLQQDLENLKLFGVHSEDLTENHQKQIQDSKSKELGMNLHSVLKTKEKENAMNNILVIECILKNLNIHDLKICRALNWTWYLIAEPFLRKQVQIVFTERGLNLEMFIESSKDFLTHAPFQSFRFEGYYTSFRIIQDFFENYGRNVKKLTFHSIVCEAMRKNNFNFQLASFNITPWIDPLNLTKLHLVGNFDFYIPYHTLRFNLTGLYSLEDILIWNYKINIANMEKRIAPTRIHMDSFHFYYGKTLLQQFHLNDIFDFRKAKHINLSGWGRDDVDNLEDTKLSLDLSFESVNADCVSLSLIDLQNVEACTWIVDTWMCNEIGVLSRITTMQIRCVHFTSIVGSLDLYCLPATIEALEIHSWDYDGRVGIILCSKPIKLSNIKYLYFSCQGLEMESYFSMMLAKCDKLIKCDLQGPGILHIEENPSSLAVMKLSQIIPVWTTNSIGNESFHLRKLILEYYNMDEIKKVTSIIKCLELVLVLNWNYEDDPDPSEEILQFVLENNNENSLKKIVCGMWEDPNHQLNFNISLEFVDNRAGYYSFENKHGTELSYEEFHKCSSVYLK